MLRRQTLSAQPQKDFCAPTLKPNDICNLLNNELNIPFTFDDILKPSTPRLLHVFELLIELLMGSSALQGINCGLNESNELYKDALELVSFNKVLAKLCRTVGVKDYSLRDLIKPEPARVKKILSAIINFCRFREDTLDLFTNHSTQNAFNEQKCRDLQKASRDLIENIQERKAFLESKADQVNKNKNVNNEIQKHLIQQKKKQTNLVAELETLKNTKNELNDLHTNNDYLLLNLKQDIQKIRGRIVKSPKKLVSSIKELEAKVATEKENLDSIEKNSMQLTTKLNTLSSAHQDIQSLLELIVAVDNEMNNYKIAQNNYGSENKNFETKQNEAKELKNRLLHLTKQMNLSNDKIVRLNEQYSAKREQMNDKFQYLSKEYESVSNEREKILSEMNENYKVCEQYEAKIKNSKSAHQHAMQEVNALVKDLHSIIYEYVQGVDMAMIQTQDYCNHADVQNGGE